MFLQILGVIFLIIICAVAYFGWKIYRFAKAQKNSPLAIAMAALPALEMELEPSTSEEWVETERLGYLESEMKKVGASHVGYFCVYSGYAIIRVSMWNYKDQAVAVIYEAASEFDEDNVSLVYEVACKVHGGSICITSNPHAVYDSRPEKHPIFFNESNSIVEFLKALKSEIPEGRKILKIENAKEFFTECYEDTSEFRWRPEQIRNEKTQQMFSSLGVTVTEDLIDQLIEMGVSYSNEVHKDRARRSLAKHSSMKADEWEKIRDRLVFVHEKMTVDHLVEGVYEIAGDLTEIQEQALEGFENNTDELLDPIGAFQMLLQSLNLKAKRIAKMDAPIKTEVYLPL